MANYALPQSTLAVWVKWPFHPSAPDLAGHKRPFGSVCHQDPRSVLPAPLLSSFVHVSLGIQGRGVAASLLLPHQVGPMPQATGRV